MTKAIGLSIRKIRQLEYLQDNKYSQKSFQEIGIKSSIYNCIEDIYFAKDKIEIDSFSTKIIINREPNFLKCELFCQINLN